MTIFEWILLAFFALSFFGGIKFISDGGYDTSRNERLVGIILNFSILAALILTPGLTWFGWVLLGLSAYSVGAGMIKYVRHPESTHTSTKATAVQTVLALIYMVLLLAVGVS